MAKQICGGHPAKQIYNKQIYSVTSRLFAVHHTGTGEITEGLDGLGCDFCSGRGLCGGFHRGSSLNGGGGLCGRSGSGLAGSEGFGGASLLGGARCLAGGLASSEFLDGGLVGGFLGDLVSGSLNLFSGFAFDLVVAYSKSGVDLDVVSVGLLLDLASQDLSELPVAVSDELGGSLAEQFLFDDFLGRVGVDDLADFASSPGITDIDSHAHAVRRSVGDGPLQGLGGSECLGGGHQESGKGEGANNLHLGIVN
mmetsp:Transcript_7763/g.15145  ORF Transcript_7763/g.15145 Transcript_7763/m.15145 type:complete len:253 (-) Transcript_7763:82-840(-)